MEIILLKAGSLFKMIQVLLLSAMKFIFAPPLSFELGFTFIQTIFVTTIGGLIGVIFFYFLSEIILKLFRRIWPDIKSFFKKPVAQTQITAVIKKRIEKHKKYFSRKNKFIIMLRRKWGLWGIAILTPVLLSIPLGTFLANKYYRNKRSVLFSLALSVICWSIIISSIYILF
jgi:hypothetical protein